MKKTKPGDMLTETISFRVTDAESRILVTQADREQRTVSQLVRVLLRTALRSDAVV